MESLFTTAWQKKAWWLWLLLPLSWLYRLISWFNKKLYDIHLKPVYYSPVPVIVIGNITVGGSGKTPLIIALVQYLQGKNIPVGVISRGYGGDTSQMPALVTPQSSPAQVGDEPCLIVQSTILQSSRGEGLSNGVPMAVCPNRGQAIELLLKHYPDTKLILADDGLQHHALDRDKNWVVVDSDRGFGNGQVLPTGFLREPIKRLFEPNTTVIFHQKNWETISTISPNNLSKNNFSNLFMTLQEQALQPLFPQVDLSLSLNPQYAPNVIAMTGIGFPPRFFNSVKRLGFDLVEMPFNDHHNFSLADFEDLPDLPIVITAKDAVKMRLLLQAHPNDFTQGLRQKIWVLPVVAKLSDKIWAELDKQLLGLGV